MRILIDIGHPAHVHYFKHFIRIMKEKGHEFLITARDKEITFDLLKKYKIKYISRGKGGKSLLSKFLYIPKADYLIFKESKKFKPDIFLSFASPYAAQVSKIFLKPHIALSDTEHDTLGNLGFVPFSETIITPDCYLGDFKRKHIKVKSYFELCYLSPKYFNPELDILKELNISRNQKVVLFRFVSWEASHDRGHNGISFDKRKELVNLFERNNYKILISSEGYLAKEFEMYKILISPEKIHSVISSIDIFIGESGTMATEAAILGTPSVFVNSLDAGVFQDEVRLGLLYSYRTDDKITKIVIKLIKNRNLKNQHLRKRKMVLNEKIDLTDFLIWFIENYPKSKRVMNENPDYQLRFK